MKMSYVSVKVFIIFTLVGLYQVKSDSLQAQINSLKATVATLSAREAVFREQLASIVQKQTNSSSAASSGAVYIRWGRTTCAGDAKVVYEGQAATSHWSNAGSGANMLCLHSQPQYANHPTPADWRGLIYGVKYGLHPEHGTPFSLTNYGGQSINENDMPCVVCHVSTRKAQVMIPARRECPSNWTMEYNGYLVSSHESADRHRSSFDCLDDAPETIPSGTAGFQAIVYPVLGVCGTLRCGNGKFVDQRQLTCVVCTK